MNPKKQLAIFYVETTPVTLLLGTHGAINDATIDRPIPTEHYETVLIEDRLAELYEKNKAVVDEIPEMRQLVKYPEEHYVEFLDRIYAMRDESRTYTPRELMAEFMKVSRGHANPHFVWKFIEEVFAVSPIKELHIICSISN